MNLNDPAINTRQVIQHSFFDFKMLFQNGRSRSDASELAEWDFSEEWRWVHSASNFLRVVHGSASSMANWISLDKPLNSLWISLWTSA